MQNALSPVYCNMPRATYQSTINGGSGAGGGTSSGGSAVNTTTERPDSGVGSLDAGERNPGKKGAVLCSLHAPLAPSRILRSRVENARDGL
jgi:hypothetical protein